MDFDWSPEELEFRQELRTFVEDHVPEEWRRVPVGRYVMTAEDRERTLAFTHELGKRGWLTPHWPVEYGGSGMSTWAPAGFRLGPENGGWDVVSRALQNERVGSPRWERAARVRRRGGLGSRAHAGWKILTCWTGWAKPGRRARRPVMSLTR
jgi:alkylation response protein AidB-like acyl-CoA dehydrogenase